MGKHKVYNEFVKSKLNAIDINCGVEHLIVEVYNLQRILRILTIKGLPLYKKGLPNFPKQPQGATIQLWEKWYKKIKNQIGGFHG